MKCKRIIRHALAHLAAAIVCAIDTARRDLPDGGLRADYRDILDNHGYSYTGAWRRHEGIDAWRASSEYAAWRTPHAADRSRAAR